MTDDASKLLALVVTAAVVLSIFGLLLRRFFQNDTPQVSNEPTIALVPIPVERCICGAPATDPAPILARERGSAIRDFLGMPPRYRRVVGGGGARVYCRSHAHTADACLTHWLADQRAQTAAVYARMAQSAAAYETSGLAQAVEDSLTGAQRTKAEAARSKRPSNGAEPN